MAELVQEILQEIKSVKEKVVEMDREFHEFRDEFADTHMNFEEREMLAEALEEERQGKTVSIAEVKRRLGF